MRISTKGRYALRILLDLAQQDTKKPVSLRSIADRQHISEKYLEGIVSRLSAAQLVRSIRGKYGGYTLSRAPSEYTILDILLATEDSMAIIASLDEGVATETAVTDIAVGFWAGLQNYIHDYLQSVTLEDILQGTYAKLDDKYDHYYGLI
ncbi:RrF2 family transcriptional regulator [Veillonella montpellierensis]|uniref:RrF2 family transcriptional regulator n=1 Tax=Veillonella montpellierensis TaxID=187328 RepID=UPI0023F68771|nr:Rrf2 family transcriptional regulator [Veillonella montpellierensis]